MRRYIPAAVTLTSTCLGLLASYRALQGSLIEAGWLIGFAMLCDMVDGAIARALHAESAIGAQLDSFSDLISFGIAPAVLLYEYGLYHFGIFGSAATAFWVIMAQIRLAMFNVKHGGDKRYFIGLASPAAAMSAVGTVWMFQHATQTGVISLIAVLLFGIGMVLPLRWPSFRSVFAPRGESDYRFRWLVVLAIAVGILALPYYVTPALVYAYAVIAPIGLLRTSRQPTVNTG